MNKKNRLLVSIFSFVMLFFITDSNLALAEDTEASSAAGAAGFTTKLNFPENQASDVGYFDLKMSPGQGQTVTVTLTNPSTTEVVVDVSINGAKTNSNGVIEYGDTTIENDASLKFDFKDIVTAPKSVTLAPNSSTDVEFKIQMPETSFDGILLGGIKFEKQEKEEAVKKGSGSVVNNKFAYAYGMVLRETDASSNPEVKLNKVYAGASNYKNTIFVNYSNVQPEILNDVSVEVQITKKGNSNVLYESKTTKMRMAPNSQMDYPVSMNGERMVSGNYTAKVLFVSGDYSEEWEKDFEITQKQADQFNERDVGLTQEKGIDWKIIVAIVVGVIVLVIIVFGIMQIIKKNKKTKNKKKKKK